MTRLTRYLLRGYDAIGRLARMLDFSAIGMGGPTDLLKALPGGAGRLFAGGPQTHPERLHPGCR